MAIGIWQLAWGLPAFPANMQPGIFQPPVLESINRTLTGLSFIILVFGVILIFSGVATFLHYRKENPIPYKEKEIYPYISRGLNRQVRSNGNTLVKGETDWVFVNVKTGSPLAIPAEMVNIFKDKL